ncbi:hypothetical protein [Streptomyces sp. NPDC059076]|uniref:hypothetical protein n=1 Tax=unclassified Streptomyces TaxID=2593676 RepID=UPI00367E7153
MDHSTPERTFDVAMDGTLHFTLRAHDEDHAHEQLAGLESCEADIDAALPDGVRLTHITYGTADSYSLSPADAPATSPATAGPADTYLLGLHLQTLTDQLNGADSYHSSAALLLQVLEPNRGLLEKLGDFFEAAAEKARDAESDDGFDLRDNLTDAAADIRLLGEQLHFAVELMRDLDGPNPPAPAHTTARTATAPVPQPQLPPSGRTR